MNYFDIPIAERIAQAKKENVLDATYPPGTERRKRFDEMIEKTIQAMQESRTKKAMHKKKELMDTPPSEFLGNTKWLKK